MEATGNQNIMVLIYTVYLFRGFFEFCMIKRMTDIIYIMKTAQYVITKNYMVLKEGNSVQGYVHNCESCVFFGWLNADFTSENRVVEICSNIWNLHYVHCGMFVKNQCLRNLRILYPSYPGLHLIFCQTRYSAGHETNQLFLNGWRSKRSALSIHKAGNHIGCLARSLHYNTWNLTFNGIVYSLQSKDTIMKS